MRAWHHRGIGSLLESKERSFDRLMIEHKDAVYRQIARTCGNYDDAQDVLVETLLAAYRALDQVRDPEAMRGWLATIGRRICRRMKQKEALAPVLALDHEPCVESTADEELERSRVHQCVGGAVRRLPESYRQAYILKDLQGLSLEEAAQQAGITVQNFKSRLHRARQKIREELDSGICGEIES